MRVRLRLLGVTVASIVVDLHDGLETIELDDVMVESEEPCGGWKFEATE